MSEAIQEEKQAVWELPPEPEFELRPLQREIILDDSRFKVVVIHRRFGKTVLAIEFLKKCLADCTYPNPQVFFVFPFATQGEAIAWRFLLAQTASIVGMNYTAYRMEAEFPVSEAYPRGGLLKFLGAEQYNKHRGKWADAVCFDEVPDIAPAAWRQVFRPLLSDRLGKALFIGTPRGHDWFKALHDNAAEKQMPGWRAWHKTVYETRTIVPEEIEALRREMLPDEFAREYLCDWDVAANGAFFQHQINAMIEDDRALDNPYKKRRGPVHTGWHLDKTDQITVTFWQHYKKKYYCIDTLHEYNGSMADVVAQMNAKPYSYGAHHGPVKFAIGSHRWHTAALEGFKILPNPQGFALMDSIELVKSRLPRVRIDREHAANLIEAGRQFHATFDELTQNFKNDAVWDWSAEYCQSMANFFMGHKERPLAWAKAIEYPEVFRA